MNFYLDNLKDDKICLSYLGFFIDDITDKLIGISEAYLENKSDIGKIKNKVSFLIAESFQNIVKHGVIDVKSKAYGFNHSDFFQINVLSDRVCLSSCNLVETSYIKTLEAKLVQINSLNTEELKLLYNDLLANGEFSDKGGAGLGLVEMARKSGLPIKYFFKDLTSEFSQFYLSIEISGKKDNVEEKIDIDNVILFHQKLIAQQVMMLYKGDFSKESIVPLIDMLQHNFGNKETLSSNEKRSVITLIETFQNIAKHGKTVNDIKEGIFTISKQDEQYILEVGNYIEEREYNILTQTLSTVKSMDSGELTDLYKRKLVESEITPEGNSGLGLLEIARQCDNHFMYSFNTNPENGLFYSIKITV